MIATVNNTQIWYETLGSGPPLVLLHGGPGLDHTEFRPWLDPLATHFTLVFVDERGTGRSARVDPSTATTENMVADIEALRQHLGYEQIALLGFSFGGFLALAYAAQYQQHLSHLLLVSTAPSHAFGPSQRRSSRRLRRPKLRPPLRAKPPSPAMRSFAGFWTSRGRSISRTGPPVSRRCRPR